MLESWPVVEPSRGIAEEIREALLRLPPVDRSDILSWLEDLASSSLLVAEPRAAYASRAEPPHMSVDEYLRLEAGSETKHEYVAGKVFAMAGTSLRHNLIVRNVAGALAAHLRGGPCETFFTDVKVRIAVRQSHFFYYPDVLVACGALDIDKRVIDDPRLVLEVLSPSTARADRWEKALNYQQILTLEEYVLVAQERPEVTIHRRRDDWQPLVLTGLDAAADLQSVALSLSLREIYEGAA